ncbi:MAG TPA: cytochrome c [Steroidobacteraceae bacterium]|nr:cytochrome c [Steroidobacteraceae bacterium]
MFRRKGFRTVGAAMVVASLIAAVHAATPAETQKARHEHYEELGKAFKAVRDQMTAGSPDYAALAKSADVVHKASIDQGKWFPKGTGPEAGKTRALAEIWSKPADFEAAQKMFEGRAPKLLAAAKARDVDAVKAAFKDVGGACKNCHDTFRSPEE